MENFYELAERMKQIYDALQDEKSREIFWARLRYDMEPVQRNAFQLEELSEVYLDSIQACMCDMPDKKMILYGAGAYGRLVGARILQSGKDFWGYCDQKAEKETVYVTIQGKEKPVYSPEYLFQSPQDYCVVITATDSFMEIMELLWQRQFPADHILPCIHMKQYFDFPECFQSGTAFVDIGCCDSMDSIRFAQWSRGKYSKILAFEPEEANYKKCLENAQRAGIQNFEVVEAALSNCAGEQKFTAELGTSSHLLETTSATESLNNKNNLNGVVKTVRICKLDDFTNETTVGFIKMDIEGAEFDSLQGAQKTIQRDKPLLAICVYHRRGDVLAIMDYLHSVVPDYRFWLRHYGPLQNETVLYAAI
ncbi:FkbM family methyltransferase [Flintibacter muris]|uniref:FkbM family methyltransferase n=1 Tax=Flintibacter muris TaxID=2941327 RepID=UPI00203A7322|nr:FkbM family methyltransferase [Flintibacter muris]